MFVKKADLRKFFCATPTYISLQTDQNQHIGLIVRLCMGVMASPQAQPYFLNIYGWPFGPDIIPRNSYLGRRPSLLIVNKKFRNSDSFRQPNYIARGWQLLRLHKPAMTDSIVIFIFLQLAPRILGPFCLASLSLEGIGFT